jgi:hypothetical protein
MHKKCGKQAHAGVRGDANVCWGGDVALLFPLSLFLFKNHALGGGGGGDPEER